MLGDQPVAGYRVGDFLPSAVFRGDELVWQPDPVSFTVESDTFVPWLQVAPGSTAQVQWLDEDGFLLASGLQPTITWTDSGPHVVTLRCNRPHEITSVNLGYHSTQDQGWYVAGSTQNYPAQGVTAVDNLQVLSGLRQFMAARTNGSSPNGADYTGPLLQGHLNFAGMQHLQYIECYMSQVQSVTLTGCTSLVRLCLEQTNLESLDLNPVAGNLRDLRAAVMGSGTLYLVPLQSPMQMLYHFCVRRQNLINMPEVETMLPAIQQLWIWENSIDVDEMVVRSSAPEGVHSLLLASPTTGGGTVTNQIRSLDVAGITWADLQGPARLEAMGVGMEDIQMTGMGPLGRIYLQNNALPSADVGHVLEVVEGWGTSGGELLLAGNQPPDEAGLTRVATLQSRGWTVTFTTPHTTGELLWQDEFDRPDTQGWANVGWSQPSNGGDLDIVSEQLRFYGGSSFQRTFVLPPELEGITDYDVELEFEQASASAGWFGILARMASNSSGAMVLFPSGINTPPRCGTAGSASQPDMSAVTGGFPVGWNTPGVHTIRFRLTDNVGELFIDGQLAARRSGSDLRNGTASGVGICGQSLDRLWRAIRVYALPSP